MEWVTITLQLTMKISKTYGSDSVTHFDLLTSVLTVIAVLTDSGVVMVVAGSLLIVALVTSLFDIKKKRDRTISLEFRSDEALEAFLSKNKLEILGKEYL